MRVPTLLAVAILLLLLHREVSAVTRGEFTAGPRVPVPVSPSEFANTFNPGLGFEFGWIFRLSPSLGLTVSYEADVIPLDGEKILRDSGLAGFDPPTRSARELRLLLGLRRTFSDGSWRPYLRTAAGAGWLTIPEVIVVPDGYSIDSKEGVGFAVVGGGGFTWRPTPTGPEVTLGADYATAFGEIEDADVLSLRIGVRGTGVTPPDSTLESARGPKHWFFSVGSASPIGSGTLSAAYKSGFGLGMGWEIPWSERLSGVIRLDYDAFGFDEDGFRESHGFGPGSFVEGDNGSASSILLAVRGYASPVGRTPYLETGFGRIATRESYSGQESGHFESRSSDEGATTLYAATGLRMVRDRVGPFAEASIHWFAPDDDMKNDDWILRVRVGVMR